MVTELLAALVAAVALLFLIAIVTFAVNLIDRWMGGPTEED